MTIVIVGIDLGKNPAAWRAWTRLAGSFYGVECGGTCWRASSRAWGRALSPWRPVAALIIWGGFSRRRATKFD